MNKLNKQEREALKQGEQLMQLLDSQGWQEVLKPWLEAKLKNSWLDPRKVKEQDKFFYEYVVAWGFAQASSEILHFLEEKKSETQALRDKKKGIIKKDFRIGK